MQTRRLGSQLQRRCFSTTLRQYAAVNSLGVIGSGQMVSVVGAQGVCAGLSL